MYGKRKAKKGIHREMDHEVESTGGGAMPGDQYGRPKGPRQTMAGAAKSKGKVRRHSGGY